MPDELAKEAGTRLAIIVEQRGCIYCKLVHEEVLSDQEVRRFIEAHFMVVQYNLYGDEEMIDTYVDEFMQGRYHFANVEL